MTVEELVAYARGMDCSDIHITGGLPVLLRKDGALLQAPWRLSESETDALLLSLLPQEALRSRYVSGEDMDFSFTACGGQRQRVNLFHQQGSFAAAIRLLGSEIPTLAQLGLPRVLQSLAQKPRGLILVTGPTGSGKSTTLASMVDDINASRAEHIITIEDPIEYVYPRRRSLIHQRQVGQDVPDFARALRSALREDPDILLVGEMRDYETIAAVLTAAETGHLVLSTLHTTGAAQTVDRIVDSCPGQVQNQIRTQLAGVLQGVITQCLVPKIGGGRVAVTEILTGTDAALNMIRENRGHQLKTVMQSGAAAGMHTLNAELARLVRENSITRQDALRYTYDAKDFSEYLA